MVKELERPEVGMERVEYMGAQVRLQRASPEKQEAFRRCRTPIVSSFIRMCELREGMVDGPVSPVRAAVGDKETLTQEVKELARYLGADLVGASPVREQHVYKGKEILHPYAIVVGMQMDYEKIKRAPSPSSTMELWRVYNRVADLVVHLAAYIRGLGYSARAHHVRTAELMLVPSAIEAGLGEVGRMGLLVTREFGPRVRLGAVTTDLPLRVDNPVDIGVQDFCQECTVCLRHCPASAIPQEKTLVRGTIRWVIDADKCFDTFAEAYGCGLCIKCCPLNKPRVRRQAET